MTTPPRCTSRRQNSVRVLAGVLAAVLSALLVLGSGGAADAAVNDSLLAYRGVTIHKATLPATALTLTAVSDVPMTAVSVVVAGRVLGSSTSVRREGGRLLADVPVDLTGLSGRTTVQMVLRSGGASTTLNKVVYLVPPPRPTAAPTPTAQPPTSQPGPTVDPSTAVPTSSQQSGSYPNPTPSPSTSSSPSTSVASSNPPVLGQPTPPRPADLNPAAPTSPTPVPTTGSRPGPATTGVTDGAVLTPSGSITITTPGAVVSNLDISGCVTVLASDVTIRNVRIQCSAPPRNRVVLVDNGVRNLVIEDSEINGMGTAEIGIGWSNYTLRRVEITGTCDGARIGTNILIEDSWIHDLVRQGSLHCDALQTTEGGNIVVRRNSLDPRTTTSLDLNNAAIMLGTETGTRRLDGAVFESNWIGGGNYSVNVRSDASLSGVVFRGNVYVGGARYGPATAPATVLFEGNTAADGSSWRVQPAR